MPTSRRIRHACPAFISQSRTTAITERTKVRQRLSRPTLAEGAEKAPKVTKAGYRTDVSSEEGGQRPAYFSRADGRLSVPPRQTAKNGHAASAGPKGLTRRRHAAQTELAGFAEQAGRAAGGRRCR